MRTLAVAVTGHRPNRLRTGQPALRRRLRLVLAALRQGAGAAGGPPRAISALAEGADRLFASVALDLGYELHVLLPFASADYETTFSVTGARGEYHALLVRAGNVATLPGSLADSKASYEAVGRATVDAADVLVAVWDGKGAAGRGGSPEIIAYALTQGVPVIWIDAARARLPRLITGHAASDRPAQPFDAERVSAQRLPHRRIAALARGCAEAVPSAPR